MNRLDKAQLGPGAEGCTRWSRVAWTKWAAAAHACYHLPHWPDHMLATTSHTGQTICLLPPPTLARPCACVTMDQPNVRPNARLALQAVLPPVSGVPYRNPCWTPDASGCVAPNLKPPLPLCTAQHLRPLLRCLEPSRALLVHLGTRRHTWVDCNRIRQWISRPCERSELQSSAAGTKKLMQQLIAGALPAAALSSLTG